MLNLNRRTLLGSMISLVAAPAIVRVTSLMPVKALPLMPPLPVMLSADAPSVAHIGDLWFRLTDETLLAYDGTCWLDPLTALRQAIERSDELTEQLKLKAAMQ